jgi:hypothetical protein
MIKRDSDKGLTEEDANHRLSSQLALEKKLPYADIVLDNADDASETLEKQVDRLVQEWKRKHITGFGRLRNIIQWLIPPVGIVMAAWAVLSRISRVARNKKEANAKARSE